MSDSNVNKEIIKRLDALEKGQGELYTETALHNQFNQEIVKPALTSITEKLSKLDVVTRPEFNEYKEAVQKDLEDNYVSKEKFESFRSEVRVKLGGLLWGVAVIGTIVIGAIIKAVIDSLNG